MTRKLKNPAYVVVGKFYRNEQDREPSAVVFIWDANLVAERVRGRTTLRCVHPSVTSVVKTAEHFDGATATLVQRLVSRTFKRYWWSVMPVVEARREFPNVIAY